MAACGAAGWGARPQPALPPEAKPPTPDTRRLPERRGPTRRNYLDPLNFATNFVLFRDNGTLHTRLVTANYWSGYGSSGVTCWLTLFDGDGEVIAEWCEAGGPGMAAITIDSRPVRQPCRLGGFP